LEREGRSDLRELRTHELYVDEAGDVMPIIFYPKPNKVRMDYVVNAAYCNLIYHLFLKEALILNDFGPGVVRISDLYNHRLPDIGGITPEVPPLRSALHSDVGNFAPFIFYPDFHPRELERGRFFHRHVSDEIEDFILHKLYSYNVAPVIQSCVALDSIGNDWSPAILGIFGAVGLEFEIEAPKE
jgi:hypothetical protein